MRHRHSLRVPQVTQGNPAVTDNVSRVSVARTNGILQIKFTRNTNSTDAILVVEAANSLTNNSTWTGINTNLGGVWGDLSRVVETGTTNPVNVTVSDNVSGSPQRNLRLKVDKP